jgi:hypothetical protein
MKKAIWFDMDGTIANLYGVPNWLDKLIAEDASPYTAASVIGNMNTLAKAIHRVQAKGYKVGIISWTSKGGSANYNAKVAAAKLAWLKKHLGSVKFNTIHIVPYGTNKSALCGGGILFDDEAANRANWNGKAYTPSNIISVLKSL